MQVAAAAGGAYVMSRSGGLVKVQTNDGGKMDMDPSFKIKGLDKANAPGSAMRGEK